MSIGAIVLVKEEGWKRVRSRLEVGEEEEEGEEKCQER